MINAMVNWARKTGGYRFPRLGKYAMEFGFSLFPRKMEVELFSGLITPLDFSDLTQRVTFWQGRRFEYPTADILQDWMGQGGRRFFDIGSNYGFFSYWLLSGFENIKVTAFEPNPKTYALVETIICQNRMDERMEILNAGLSDEEGHLILALAVEDSGHSTFGAHPGLINHDTVEVPVTTFDLWRQKMAIEIPEKPEWVAKIDVEGFEPKVLRGMREALQKRVFIGLAIEINEFTLDFCGSSPSEIYQIMDEYGYVPMSEFRPDQWNYGKTANVFFVPDNTA